MTALAALCGAGVGLGVVLVAWSVAGRPSRLTPHHLPRLGGERLAPRLAWAVGAGVVMGAATRWPVGALLAGAAGFALPSLLGGKGAREAAVARTEAIAGWTEMLRDTMAAAAGLEQAIAATAPVAPPPVRAEVAILAARLRAREPLGEALRSFADDVADPTADLVVAALVVAAERRAAHLGELLGALATAAREQASMRLRVEAGRARTRTAVRVVCLTTLAMAVGLVVFDRGYLAPYDDAVGQLALAVVGACFAGALRWMAHMARVATPERILAAETFER